MSSSSPPNQCSRRGCSDLERGTKTLARPKAVRSAFFFAFCESPPMLERPCIWLHGRVPRRRRFSQAIPRNQSMAHIGLRPRQQGKHLHRRDKRPEGHWESGLTSLARSGARPRKWCGTGRDGGGRSEVGVQEGVRIQIQNRLDSRVQFPFFFRCYSSRSLLLVSVSTLVSVGRAREGGRNGEKTCDESGSREGACVRCGAKRCGAVRWCRGFD